MAGTPWVLLRIIRLEPIVAEFVEAERLKDGRFVDQWDGIEDILSRTPEIGQAPIEGPEDKNLLYHFLKDDLAKTKSIVVIYSYDNEKVMIHGAAYSEELGHTPT